MERIPQRNNLCQREGKLLKILLFSTEMSPFAICQDEEGKCPQCIAMDKLGVLSDCRGAKNADILRLNWPLSEIVAAASVRLQ